MNFITLDELINELRKVLTDLKIKNIDDYILKMQSEDAVHEIDEYMQEYVGEEIINNQTYLKYHSWFELDNKVFEHNVYYLKEDLLDDSIESYVKAHKLYSK